MLILDLVKSNSKFSIRYQIQKFPDGQQNIVLDAKDLSDSIFNKISHLGKFEIKGGSIYKEIYQDVTIKSRLNNWLDLELITCAVTSLRGMGVENIHLYTPYILGGRSDRKFEEGGNNYIKDVIAPAINALKFKTVKCMDPHSDVLEACINNFVKLNNYSLVEFALNSISPRNIPGNSTFKESYDLKNILFVSPDAGANKKIFKVADKIGYKGEIITCSKDRDTEGKLTRTVVPVKDTGPLYKKDYIIIDDICDGGATFINIAKEIKKLYNCDKIYLIVTHGIFSKGFEDLSKYFDGIYCTNSYSDLNPNDLSNLGNRHLGDFVKQLNVF